MYNANSGSGVPRPFPLIDFCFITDSIQLNINAK